MNYHKMNKPTLQTLWQSLHPLSWLAYEFTVSHIGIKSHFNK